MRVAVCSQGDTLDSRVDERFGRSPYFVVVETETARFEAVRNPGADSAHGAGVGAVRVLLSQNVSVVVTGNAGPNALRALEEAGIEVYRAEGGTVREVVERLQAGSLERLTTATRYSEQHS